MRKSLSSLWLKSFKRISKVQQRQGSALMRSLLGSPAPAKRKPAKSKVDPVQKVLRSVGLLKPPAASRAAVASKPAPRKRAAAEGVAHRRAAAHPAADQGQWLRSFHL